MAGSMPRSSAAGLIARRFADTVQSQAQKGEELTQRVVQLAGDSLAFGFLLGHGAPQQVQDLRFGRFVAFGLHACLPAAATLRDPALQGAHLSFKIRILRASSDKRAAAVRHHTDSVHMSGLIDNKGCHVSVTLSGRRGKAW